MEIEEAVLQLTESPRVMRGRILVWKSQERTEDLAEIVPERDHVRGNGGASRRVLVLRSSEVKPPVKHYQNKTNHFDFWKIKPTGAEAYCLKSEPLNNVFVFLNTLTGQKVSQDHPETPILDQIIGS